MSPCSCVFCQQDRALRAANYDAQICEHLLWHVVTPQVVTIQDSWQPVERPEVRNLESPHPLTRAQEDFLPLLAKLRAGGTQDLSTSSKRNVFKRTYCLVRTFLGFAAELGDMPSQLEEEDEDRAARGGTVTPKVEDLIYYAEDDAQYRAVNASLEVGDAGVLGEEPE